MSKNTPEKLARMRARYQNDLEYRQTKNQSVKEHYRVYSSNGAKLAQRWMQAMMEEMPEYKHLKALAAKPLTEGLGAKFKN